MTKAENLENTISYLNSLYTPLRIVYNDAYNSIFIVQHLIKLVEKKLKKHKLTNKDFEVLVQYGCPDTLAFAVESDGRDNDELVSQCSNIKCSECWKQYLDMIIEADFHNEGTYRNLES